jgi:RNase P/RNase MRP subunit p29
MEELLGFNVKVTLNDYQGFVVISGSVLKATAQYILLKTVVGPLYVFLHAIKTIQILGTPYDKK